MTNQFYTKGDQFDYLDFYSELKRIGKKKFVKKIFQESEENYSLFLSKIKSLGLEINEYAVVKGKNPFSNNYKEMLNQKMSDNDREKIMNHLNEVDLINNLFIQSNISINKIIEDNVLQIQYILPQFLVYLENSLWLLGNHLIEGISLEQSSTSFDSYISSSGIILKYLMHNYSLENQKGINRIFSENDLKWNFDVYKNYTERDNLMDAFEYWKYSEIDIKKNRESVTIDFSNEDFNRSVLVGNFRHKKFMIDTEIDIINYKNKEGEIDLESSSNNIYIDHVSKELCIRYFGKENMSNLLLGVELNKWLDAIHFFQNESINFLKARSVERVLSVQNLCIVKTKFEWKKKLTNFSKKINKQEAEIIVNKLIFNKNTRDLIDAPLIKVKDKLVLLPTLTKEIRPLSAILSIFSASDDGEERPNLSFKGNIFENRVKIILKNSSGIDSERLHVKIDEKELEREIDIAFVLDEDLFFIECKSFNQPYTVREHATVHKKIRDSIVQLKRNATYFENNLAVVKQQLKIEEEIEIKEVHHVLLTSTTLGEAGGQSGIYLTDEASFNSFLLRNSPNLTLFEDNKKTVIPIDKSGIYSGKITSKKLLMFLKEQPSIESMKKRITKVLDNEGSITYHCCKKTIEDVYVSKDKFD